MGQLEDGNGKQENMGDEEKVRYFCELTLLFLVFHILFCLVHHTQIHTNRQGMVVSCETGNVYSLQSAL